MLVRRFPDITRLFRQLSTAKETAMESSAELPQQIIVQYLQRTIANSFFQYLPYKFRINSTTEPLLKSRFVY